MLIIISSLKPPINLASKLIYVRLGTNHGILIETVETVIDFLMQNLPDK